MKNKKTKANSAKEGNKFDKILHENLEPLIPVLLRKVMGIVPTKMENVPQLKQQTTLEREPDFLKKVFDAKHPEGKLVQIEFEGKDEKETDYRFLEYLGIILRKYKIPLDQHLIYLPKGVPKQIRGEIVQENLYFRYEVHCISQISYIEFLYSDIPEEVLLSILSNPEDQQPEELIELILRQLIKLKGDSLATRKFLKQLEVLSLLRNLQEATIKQIDMINLSYDITKDVRYNQGKDVGLEQGLEQGRLETTIFGIRNMLLKNLAEDLIAEILNVESSFVIQIKQELKKENEIITLLKTNKLSQEQIAKKLDVSEVLVSTLQNYLLNH